MDIWQINLDSGDDLTALRDLLDPNEKARADRFLSESVARRFVVSHSAVRRILSTYVGQCAQELVFEYNGHGKPALAGGGSPSFSLSHSGELALCAVAQSGELGVDIEQWREVRVVELAKRFFSATESRHLLSLPDHELKAGFFSCWSRKEAYIKAKGLGLSLPLDQFSVELRPGMPAALLDCAYAPDDVGRFRYWNVPVPPGFAAAVAYNGPDEGAPNFRSWVFSSRA